MKKIFVILIGILFAVVGTLVLVYGNAKSKRCREETIGTIVDIKQEWSSDSDGNSKYTYYPIIRYQVGERTITKQSNIGTTSNTGYSVGGGVTVSFNNSKYNINDTIPVFYNPDNVEEFIIKGEKKLNFILGIVFIIMGSISVIIGIISKQNY